MQSVNLKSVVAHARCGLTCLGEHDELARVSCGHSIQPLERKVRRARRRDAREPSLQWECTSRQVAVL